MPLYEFECAKCGHKFECLVRRPSDETGLTCPKCGAGKVRKLFSTFATAGTEKASGSGSSSCSSCSGGTCSTCH